MTRLCFGIIVGLDGLCVFPGNTFHITCLQRASGHTPRAGHMELCLRSTGELYTFQYLMFTISFELCVVTVGHPPFQAVGGAPPWVKPGVPPEEHG